MRLLLLAFCTLSMIVATQACVAPSSSEPQTTQNREWLRTKEANTKLVIFVHGFTGHYRSAWAQFPDLVIKDSELNHYDVLMWGYPSKKLSRNPKIDRIGQHLKTEIDHLSDRYQHIVIAAHSMGGLVVRASVVNALTEGQRDELTKIKHIVLYGTPNEGIDKTNFVPDFVNRQIADMNTASEFIIELRDEWLDHVYRAKGVDDQYHLEIPTTAVAGLEDRFVPAHSVSTFFRDFEITDGDHGSMVKPASEDHLSLKILRKKMLGPVPDYDSHDADQSNPSNPLVEKLVDMLAKQLDANDNQLGAKDEQIAELTKAIEALVSSKDEPNEPEDIDAALDALAKGDTKLAEAQFQSVIDAGETESVKTAAAYRHLGALAYLHDTEKALNAYRRSTELDPTNADGWNQLGHLLRRTGDLDSAIAAYKSVMDLGDDDKVWTATAYGNLGIVNYKRGDLDQALAMFEKALAIYEKLGNRQGVADQYGSLGVVYYTRGYLDQAAPLFEKALAINEELSSKEGVAKQYGNLGNVYYTRGELDKAEEFYLKALKINEVLGNQEGMSANFGNLGNVYKTQGDLVRAVTMYEKALIVDEELDRKEGMAANYANLGIVYKTRGELDKARDAWEQALSLYKNIGMELQVEQTLRLINGLPDSD